MRILSRLLWRIHASLLCLVAVYFLDICRHVASLPVMFYHYLTLFGSQEIDKISSLRENLLSRFYFSTLFILFIGQSGKTNKCRKKKRKVHQLSGGCGDQPDREADHGQHQDAGLRDFFMGHAIGAGRRGPEEGGKRKKEKGRRRSSSLPSGYLQLSERGRCYNYVHKVALCLLSWVNKIPLFSLLLRIVHLLPNSGTPSVFKACRKKNEDASSHLHWHLPR